MDDGAVLIVAPVSTPMSALREFVQRKAAWVLERLAYLERYPPAPPAPVEDERDSIVHRGVAIDYAVRRSGRRRTLQLQMHRGDIVVRAPVRTSRQALRDFVLAHAEWVLERLEQHALHPPPPPFGHGDTVPYLGRDVRLAVEATPNGAGSVTARDMDFFGGGCLTVTVPEALDDASRRAAAQSALVAWYTERAAERFADEVAYWKPRIAPRAKVEVRIGNQRSRWGSCAQNGTLRFSWRALMLPAHLVECIAVHELAHLRASRHGPAFWRVVQKHLPDARALHRELTQRARAHPGI